MKLHLVEGDESSPVESLKVALFAAAREELAPPVGVSASSATSAAASTTPTGSVLVLPCLRARAAMPQKV